MKTLNLKSIKTNGFKIELVLGQKNQPVARVYKQITSGKNKGTDKYVEGYSFLSEEQRTAWITKRVNSIVAAANEKSAVAELKKEATAKMEHSFKVGTILYDSWGYEQTNVNFWQVIEVKEKSLIIREIAAERVSESRGDYGYKKPIADDFVGEAEVKRIGVRIYNGKAEYSINSRFGGSLSEYTKGEAGVYYSWGY